MNTELPTLREFVLELVRTLRLKRDPIYCGVQLSKVVSIIRESPYKLADFGPVFFDLLDTEEIVVTVSIGNYWFGHGSHSQCIMLSDDFPEWFDFNNQLFCIDEDGKQYDDSLPEGWRDMSSDKQTEYRQSKPPYKSFRTFKIYISGDPLPKKVENLLSKGSHNIANAVLKKLQK